MCAERRATPRRRHQGGFTLIEAIVAIVVIGVALAGLLLAVNASVRGSADPVLQRQLLAVAQQYMEEVQLQPWTPAVWVGIVTGAPQPRRRACRRRR